MSRSTPFVSVVALLVLAGGGLYSYFGGALKTPFEVYGIRSRQEIIAPASAGAQTEGWYPVDKVIDGDTVVLRIRGKRVTVRVIGLDTPEVVAPHRPVGCFGPEASMRAHQLLDNQTVRFEADPSQSEFDIYHRTLGYLFLRDGTSFEELMLQEGYGREYTFKTPYKYQKEFTADQAEARSQSLGLWKACGSKQTPNYLNGAAARE